MAVEFPRTIQTEVDHPKHLERPAVSETGKVTQRLIKF